MELNLVVMDISNIKVTGYDGFIDLFIGWERKLIYLMRRVGAKHAGVQGRGPESLSPVGASKRSGFSPNNLVDYTIL